MCGVNFLRGGGGKCLDPFLIPKLKCIVSVVNILYPKKFYIIIFIQMDLLPDWIKVESRRKPGVYYYFNSVTGQSSWDPPNIRTGEPSTDSDTRRLIETAANENNHREKIVVNLKNDEIESDQLTQIQTIMNLRKSL